MTGKPMEQDIDVISARVQAVREVVAKVGQGVGGISAQAVASSTGLEAATAQYEADKAATGATRDELVKLGESVMTQ